MPKLISQNLAILLTGQSLNDLASVVQTLGDAKQIAYAAINRKAHIEQNILGPANRSVDLWCILNPREFLHEIDNVRLFLEDDRENVFLTSSSALGSAIELIRYRPLQGHEKIVLLDDWLYAIYGSYYGRHGRPLKDLFELTGEISTLFIFLHFIASVRFYNNVYLFGCDGASAGQTTPDSQLYFMQETYDEERLKASAIHRDMVTFETEWPPCAEALLADCGIEMPKIINANVASHYTVFERRALSAVLAEIESLPKGGELKLHGYTSWNELIDKVGDELALHRFKNQGSVLDVLNGIRQENAAMQAQIQQENAARQAQIQQENSAMQAQILQENAAMHARIQQESAAIRAQLNVLLNEARQESAAIRTQLDSSLSRRAARALRRWLPRSSG